MMLSAQVTAVAVVIMSCAAHVLAQQVCAKYGAEGETVCANEM